MLAHQGGWDEMLLVLGPILVIAGLLLLAKRRVERNATSPVTHAPTPRANSDMNDVNDTNDSADGSSA